MYDVGAHQRAANVFESRIFNFASYEIVDVPQKFLIRFLNGSGISWHPHQSLGLMMDSQRYLKAMDWLSEMLPRSGIFVPTNGTMLLMHLILRQLQVLRARGVAAVLPMTNNRSLLSLHDGTALCTTEAIVYHDIEPHENV